MKIHANGTVIKKRYSPRGNPKRYMPLKYAGVKPHTPNSVNHISQTKKKPLTMSMAFASEPKDL
jgi:hypothetical protein